MSILSTLKRWIFGAHLTVDATTKAPLVRDVDDGQPLGEIEILQSIGLPVEVSSRALLLKIVNSPGAGATPDNVTIDANGAGNTLQVKAGVFDAAGAAASAQAASLQKASNLSDVANAGTARSNLGLALVAASGSYNDLSDLPSPSDANPWSDTGGDVSGATANNNAHADSHGTASGNYSHADSQGVAVGLTSHADSYGYAGTLYSHADSEGNASGTSSHADSFGIASGTNSHADSYGTATGENSHASSSGYTSGYGAHSGSYGNASGAFSHGDSDGTAAGTYSHADSSGYASGFDSHADSSGTSNGNHAHADSNGRASGDYSHASGPGSNASQYAALAHSGGQFAALGDAQYGRYCLRAATAQNDVSIPLYLDGATAELLMPSNSVWQFQIQVVARGISGACGGWNIRGVCKNDSGNVSVLGTPIVEPWDNGGLSGASIALSGVVSSLRLLVNGSSSEALNWHAVVHTSEIFL